MRINVKEWSSVCFLSTRFRFFLSILRVVHKMKGKYKAMEEISYGRWLEDMLRVLVHRVP